MMKTLYQRSDDELERLHETLTRPAESNRVQDNAIAAEANNIIEAERRLGARPVPTDSDSEGDLIVTVGGMVAAELARTIPEGSKMAPRTV